MSAHRYYARENARHPDLYAAPITKEQAADLLKALCDYKGLPPIALHFHKKPKNAKSSSSWYQSPHVRVKRGQAQKVEEHISMSETMLNALDLAHEWAHYAHRYDYRKRKLNQPKLPPERWHGPQHLALTEEAVKFLRKASSAAAPAPATRKPVEGAAVRDMLPLALELLAGRDPETLTDDQKAEIDLKVREQYMATLPAVLTCPKCLQELAQALFGARVMGRNPQGLPVRVSRQSQCRPCRNKKKRSS